MGRFKHAARIAAGYALLVLGVAGLFLPFLQGTLMIVAGAALLGWDLKALRDARHRLVSWWRGGRGKMPPSPPAPREGLFPPVRSGPGSGEPPGGRE